MLKITNKIKFNKIFLPLFLFILGVVVFSSVAVNQLYLRKQFGSEEKVTKQQDTFDSKEGENGEVAGVQEELNTESPTSTLTVKKQVTPTNKPEVKSDSNGQSNNNSNQNSNNSGNTTTVVVVTATSAPTNTPIPTYTPTPISPTPTPDNSPFDASITCNYSGSNFSYEIQANKPITNCSVSYSSTCNIAPNSDNSCNCSGNTCSSFCNKFEGSNPVSAEFTVEGSNGETKTLSCNP